MAATGVGQGINYAGRGVRGHASLHERIVRYAAANPAPARRAVNVAALTVLMLELIGSLMMWAPIPLAWMWVGGRVYALTGSLMADGTVAFLGFAGTICVFMVALQRLDRVWIALRRRLGHEQRKGALEQVVVASATLGLVCFTLWYYLFSHAYLIPFMPNQ